MFIVALRKVVFDKPGCSVLDCMEHIRPNYKPDASAVYNLERVMDQMGYIPIKIDGIRYTIIPDSQRSAWKE